MAASPAQRDAHGVATLVVANAITKLDALTIDSPVENAGTAHPSIRVADQAWVEIEIPKFGEPPPLAIDVYSSVSDEHARLEALSLAARLEPVAGWRIRPDFPVG